jgi:isopenicillin N synthase-like dioxygenase
LSNQIIPINCQSKNAGKDFVKSLHNTGFSILYNHSLNTKLISDVYEDWKLFFNSEEKSNYTFDPDKQDGYFPFRSENAKGYAIKDLKEFFHYYKWGKYPDNMSNNTIFLFNLLLDLGKELLNWIDKYSPKDIKKLYSMPLSKMISDSRMNLLRILHYPPLKDEIIDGAIRAAAHGDINLITILPAGSEPGLQILNNEGKWIDLDYNPGYLVINTGDMLSECSRGYFPSTIHQVINPNDERVNLSRYSMPLFIHPRDDVIISKKHTARSFLNERLKEIGLKT